MSKLAQFLSDIILIVVICGPVGIASAMMNKDYRKNLAFPILAIWLGVGVGYGAEQVQMLQAWSYLLALATTFCTLPLYLTVTNASNIEELASRVGGAVAMLRGNKKGGGDAN